MKGDREELHALPLQRRPRKLILGKNPKAIVEEMEECREIRPDLSV